MSIHEAAAAKLEAALADGEVEQEAPVEAPELEVPEAEEPVLEPDEVEEQPTPEEAAAAEEAGQQAVDELPDDASEEEKEQARAEAESEFYAGTYRTREDAEAGIAEKDATLKRLFSENNLLNQRLQEAEEAKQEEPAQIDPAVWDQWAAENVANGNGEQAALAALREVGYQGYEIVMRHWLSAQPDDEGEGMSEAEAARERANAVVFNNAMMLELAEVRAASAAQVARSEPTADEQRRDAHEAAKEKYPDLDDYKLEMAAAAEALSPEDAQHLVDLSANGVTGMTRALEHLYLRAKADGAVGSKAKAQQAEDARRRASESAARVAATTSTAEGTATRTPPPAAESYALERKRGLRERQNLEPLDD